MPNRSTLHKSKLEDFKEWLTANGWTIEPNKGHFEVLRARKDKRIVIIYDRIEAPQHYTVRDIDASVVMAFLREKNRRNPRM